MDRKTRICITVIIAGLINFLVYVLLYAIIYGEAIHGSVISVDGALHYYLQSDREVSRGIFIYSGLHSISIWPTVGAIMLAMLTLAKDRIISSMRSTVIRGRTLITIFATIITLMIVFLTIQFARDFSRVLSHPQSQQVSQAVSKSWR